MMDIVWLLSLFCVIIIVTSTRLVTSRHDRISGTSHSLLFNTLHQLHIRHKWQNN